GWHVRRRHQVARVDQVRDMPLVGILAADAGEVGPGALGAPQHRMVVLRFDGERVGAVALDLVAQRPDHLRMAGVAAFARVDVAAGQLERGVDPHVRRVLDGLVDGEQRRDLDQAADAGDADDRQGEADRLAFELVVEAEHATYSAAWRAVPSAGPCRLPAGRSPAGSVAAGSSTPRTV